MSRGRVALERVAIILASLALSFGLIALLSGFFAGRDEPGVSGAGGAPGRAFPDQGDAHLRPGGRRPVYDSQPPTSGAHFQDGVRREFVPLSDDQILEALELGDVVVLYGEPTPPPGLVLLARSLAPAFTPALAAAGQAVILAPASEVRGLVALAWTRMEKVRSASDPSLRTFIGYWLGRGAPRRYTGR